MIDDMDRPDRSSPFANGESELGAAPERDPASGKFRPGNKAAVGRARPHAESVARIRSAMLEAVTEDDVRDVVGALLARAKSGDVAAARELLDRLVGKAKPGPEALDDDDGVHEIILRFEDRITPVRTLRAGLDD